MDGEGRMEGSQMAGRPAVGGGSAEGAGARIRRWEWRIRGRREERRGDGRRRTTHVCHDVASRPICHVAELHGREGGGGREVAVERLPNDTHSQRRVIVHVLEILYYVPTDIPTTKYYGTRAGSIPTPRDLMIYSFYHFWTQNREKERFSITGLPG